MKALSRAWRDTNAFGRFRSTTSGVGGVVGIAAGIVGLYIWGSDEGFRDEVIVVAALGVCGILLPIIASFAWNLVRAPHRLLHQDVTALAARVSSLESNRPIEHGDALRLALLAVRSELRTCEIAIEETLDTRTWWNSGPDALPATSRNDHAEGLASRALHPQTRREIEEAYQRCHQMNRRIGNYLAFEPLRSRDPAIERLSHAERR